MSPALRGPVRGLLGALVLLAGGCRDLAFDATDDASPGPSVPSRVLEILGPDGLPLTGARVEVDNVTYVSGLRRQRWEGFLDARGRLALDPAPLTEWVDVSLQAAPQPGIPQYRFREIEVPDHPDSLVRVRFGPAALAAGAIRLPPGLELGFVTGQLELVDSGPLQSTGGSFVRVLEPILGPGGSITGWVPEGTYAVRVNYSSLQTFSSLRYEWPEPFVASGDEVWDLGVELVRVRLVLENLPVAADSVVLRIDTSQEVTEQVSRETAFRFRVEEAPEYLWCARGRVRFDFGPDHSFESWMHWRATERLVDGGEEIVLTLPEHRVELRAVGPTGAALDRVRYDVVPVDRPRLIEYADPGESLIVYLDAGEYLFQAASSADGANLAALRVVAIDGPATVDLELTGP